MIQMISRLDGSEKLLIKSLKKKPRAAIDLYAVVKTIRNYFVNRLPYFVHECKPFSIYRDSDQVTLNLNK